MKRKLNYSFLGLAFWILLFLGWEWWQSYPKVRLTPLSFPETKEERIDSLLIQSLSNFLIPGIAVGLIEDEKVTYLKSFGFGNLETKDSLTLHSSLPVASVSKLFTALSLANFAIENGISIDTVFNSLLPKNKRLPAEFDSITLRQLLEHTSGLSDHSKLRSMVIGEEKRKLSNISKKLNSPIGKKEYHYADVNFDLIGFVLESCSKMPFDSLMKVKTLTTAGMDQSFFLSKIPSDSLSALGYKQTFLWKRIQNTKLKFERIPSPSSGLAATPLDLSKAMLHLCRGSMGNFAKELEWLKSDNETPAGFQKFQINQTNFIGHFGEQGGFSSILLYSPGLEIGLFLLSNAQDKTDFRNQISSEILHLIHP